MQSEPAVKKWVNDNMAKRYGLVWERHAEGAREEIDHNVLPVLEYDGKRSVAGDGPDNILIEGDNYHALQVLNYTHRGRVDVIYIDPPYNTGAKDWKYNNDYVDGSDAYRHSKWLSFMSRRLDLARPLLKGSGILICTIDHNEQERLGLLLEEKFPSHERTCVTLVNNPSGQQGRNFSNVHEYVYFVYPARGSAIGKERRESDPDVRNFRDVTGEDSLRKAAKNCFYPILVKDGKITGFGDVCRDSFHPGSINTVDKNGVVSVYPVDPKGIERKWRYARDTVEGIKDELAATCIRGRKVWDIKRTKHDFPYKTVWNDKKFNSNTYGTQILNGIIKSKFPYPKSHFAVKECIRACVHPRNAVVLDFFAGSGTTGHAVLELNREDGGSRRFILCTNNEGGICRSVCQPRISSVMKGYRDKSGSRVEGLGSSLRYFRIDPGMRRHMDRRMIAQKIAAMLCVKESCFTAVRWSGNKYAIFKDQNGRHFGIVYAPDDVGGYLEAVRGLKGSKKAGRRPVSTYAFAHDRIIPSRLRRSPLVHTRVIPSPILNLWDRWFER